MGVNEFGQGSNMVMVVFTECFPGGSGKDDNQQPAGKETSSKTLTLVWVLETCSRTQSHLYLFLGKRQIQVWCGIKVTQFGGVLFRKNQTN